MFELSNTNIRNNYSFVKVLIEEKMKKKLKSLKFAQYHNIYFFKIQNNSVFILFLRSGAKT